MEGESLHRTLFDLCIHRKSCKMMKHIVYRRAILAALALLVATSFSFNVADAQTNNLLLSDTTIHSTLLANGTSIFEYSTKVTNRGTNEINSIELRVDVRTLTISQKILDSKISSLSSSVIDTYNLLTIVLASPLLADEMIEIDFTIMTDDIQEQYGICSDTGSCLYNMIFYVRPIHEFRNFTFIANLPVHAILANDSSPIFPETSSNFTDGRTLGFRWFTEQLLPGQEKVYILKYGQPMTTAANPSTPVDSTAWILLALLAGGGTVIVIERIPRFVGNLRNQKQSVVVGITHHENDVLRLLQRKGGSCPQRLIYEELDMSQSLASMVLAGLEERGLIKRFRDGRENIVHIVED